MARDDDDILCFRSERLLGHKPDQRPVVQFGQKLVGTAHARRTTGCENEGRDMTVMAPPTFSEVDERSRAIFWTKVSDSKLDPDSMLFSFPYDKENGTVDQAAPRLILKDKTTIPGLLPVEPLNIAGAPFAGPHESLYIPILRNPLRLNRPQFAVILLEKAHPPDASSGGISRAAGVDPRSGKTHTVDAPTLPSKPDNQSLRRGA